MGKSSKEAVDEIKSFDSVEKTRIDRDTGIASNRKRKLIAECTMMDDIFMNLVLDDVACAQQVLGVILGRRVQVVSVETQKKLIGIYGRQIIIDVLVQDEDGNLFNVEIQNAKDGVEIQRARFHSSMMDTTMLNSSQKFKELKESYVIFITPHDPFGDGLSIYKIDRYYSVNGTYKSAHDGSHIIYVNSKMQENGTELGNLMHDFNCVNPDEVINPVLRERINYFKNSEKGKDTMSAVYDEVMEQVKQEGRMEGKIMGAIQTYKKMNFPRASIKKVIIEDYHLTEAEAELYVKRYC